MHLKITRLHSFINRIKYNINPEFSTLESWLIDDVDTWQDEIGESLEETMQLLVDELQLLSDHCIGAIARVKRYTYRSMSKSS